MRGDADLRAAAAAVFGTNVRFATDDASGSCTSLPALLKFEAASVLIAAETDGGAAAAGDRAHLSAYVLRRDAGGLRLVTVKRHFADGNGSFGRVGEITPARLGADDAMVISGSGSAQGYARASADVYAFRNGDIAALGMVPTGWSNGGAEDDDSKVVTVHGKLDTGLPQPDRVRVTYTISSGGRDTTTVAVWRAQAGRFILDAGSVPKEIVTAFELPAGAIARNGTAISSADAAPPAGEPPQRIWAIDDPGLASPAREIAEVVARDPSYPAVCKLVGREMTPSLAANTRTWFVTTANQCDAADGVGPVWIVAVRPNGARSVVFSAFQHAVRAEDAIHSAFHDLLVNANTKKPAMGERYTFDGTAYRKTGS